MAEYWIIPCNIRTFNVINHFESNSKVIWKSTPAIYSGDIVYLYIGSPISEIKYKCRVITDQVTDETLQTNSYAIPKNRPYNNKKSRAKFIELEYICEYPDGSFPYSLLKENGLTQVQIQARVNQTLNAYISSIEKRLIDNPERI